MEERERPDDIQPCAADRAIPSALSLLRSWADSGECLGGQLFIWADGAVVADVAVGLSGPGRPAAETDVARLYCAVKPLTACCLARAVEAGEADFDDAASRFLPEFSSQGRATITLRQLLSHTSGMRDHLIDPYARGFHDVVRLACRCPLTESSWYRQPRYNDVLAWNVLAAVVERIYNADFATVVEELMSVVPGRPGLCARNPDPACYVRSQTLRQGSYVMLPEPRAEVMFGTVNPAHGGFASAHDLGLLYAELVRCAVGDGVLLGQECARELIRQQSIISYGSDDGQRSCGLGFMTNVTTDGMGGQWSLTSFGHAGYVGNYRVVHALGDAEHRVAAAIRLFSVGSKNNWRFKRLGDALWSDVNQFRSAVVISGRR